MSVSHLPSPYSTITVTYIDSKNVLATQHNLLKWLWSAWHYVRAVSHLPSPYTTVRKMLSIYWGYVVWQQCVQLRVISDSTSYLIVRHIWQYRSVLSILSIPCRMAGRALHSYDLVVWSICNTELETSQCGPFSDCKVWYITELWNSFRESAHFYGPYLNEAPRRWVHSPLYQYTLICCMPHHLPHVDSLVSTMYIGNLSTLTDNTV